MENCSVSATTVLSSYKFCEVYHDLARYPRAAEVRTYLLIRKLEAPCVTLSSLASSKESKSESISRSLSADFFFSGYNHYVEPDQNGVRTRLPLQPDDNILSERFQLLSSILDSAHQGNDNDFTNNLQKLINPPKRLRF